MLWTFSLSVQGESHKKKEVENPGRLFPCQDNSDDNIYHTLEELKKKKRIDTTILHEPLESDYCAAIISVADGHGSPAYFRSQKGSDRAVANAGWAMKQFSENVLENLLKEKDYVSDDYIKSFMRTFSKIWKKQIISDLSSHKITKEEIYILKNEDIHAAKKYLTALAENDYESLLPIYGTTVCSAMVIPKVGFFAMQLGDGNISVKFKDEPFLTVIAEDKNCFLNQTTSLCDRDSQSEIRFFASQRIPECVFCCTDGFENSFKDETQLMGVYEKVYELFKSYPGDIMNKKNLALEELNDWLPKLSKKGSGDDISLAGIIVE